MSDKNFLAGGMDAPIMQKGPKSTRGTTGSPLSPGVTAVTSFEAAKEYMRGSVDEGIAGQAKGGYAPLNRPGRVAERIAMPDANVQTGVKEL